MKDIKRDNYNVIDLGYESAHAVLPNTVRDGKHVEDLIDTMLQELGYKKDKNYKRQKKVHYNNVNPEASISEDFVLPNERNPDTIITVTHSNPTIPGHSNENKLHQAIGELYLFKTFNPNLRNIICIGGKKANWLPYVLDTIEFFYDATIFTWNENRLESLQNALSGPLRHNQFWKQEQILREQYKLSSNPNVAPDANLRTNFFRNVVGKYLGAVESIDDIENSVLRRMMELSIKKPRNNLWSFLKEGKSNSFYQERTLFNPPEIIVDMLLEAKGFQFKSELQNDFNEMIVTPNLLYDLGHNNSHRRTDFILETINGTKIYIECKSAGGGEGGELTKHITDRSREQIARSIFHRCAVVDGSLKSKPKEFYWYFVLDAKWRTPRSYPLKYVHNLEMCGVDGYYSCDDLVDIQYEPNYEFPLLKELERIGCKHITKEISVGQF